MRYTLMILFLNRLLLHRKLQDLHKLFAYFGRGPCQFTVRFQAATVAALITKRINGMMPAYDPAQKNRQLPQRKHPKAIRWLRGELGIFRPGF